MKAGAADFLEKPYSDHALLGATSGVPARIEGRALQPVQPVRRDSCKHRLLDDRFDRPLLVGVRDNEEGGPTWITSLSGCSDRPGAGQFMLARAKLEGEYHQRDAINQGVGPQPPGEHDSSDERRDDEEHAIGERQ
jgi:hypothetical protein